MPACKNDATKSYKGTEPSPKGLGYCSHAEKIGTTRKGRDGCMWEVKAVGKTKVKRWMKKSTSTISPSLQLFYKKKIGGTLFHANKNQYHVKVGKVVDNQFYEWKSYNTFSEHGEKIPRWEHLNIPPKVCATFLAGKNEKQMKELMKLSTKKSYIINYNGSIEPYCVYIIGRNVKVYTTNAIEKWEEGKDKRKDKLDRAFMWKWFHYLQLPETIRYTKHVATFKTQKIYIGKSVLNSATKHSGGYGKKWDGNSIVLHISGNKYIHIGATIFEFGLQKGDTIEKYWSPVGNNAVPYPFIIGKKNVYLMFDDTYISRSKLFEGVDMKTVEWSDLSGLYYTKQKEAKGLRIKPLSK